MSKTFKIDPTIFINPPYLKCLKCKEEDCYGILMIGGNSYTRRCKKCWYTNSYRLPPLNKKIIYLDQFAVSEMMKAINDKIGKSKKIDQVWFDLFERLDILTKLQLVICPDSTFHQAESLLYQHTSALKKMYEHLSHGLSFHDPATIKRFQLTWQFENHFGKNTPQIKRSTVFLGPINEWQDRFRISINFKIQNDEIIEMRKIKQKAHNGVTGVFQRWQSEKNKKFQDWYHEEGLIWGKTILRRFIDSTMKLGEFEAGRLQLTAEEVTALALDDAGVILSSLVRSAPGKPGMNEENLTAVIQFLNSKELLKIPSNHIQALLWACLAHQAAHGGRKKPPNIGMVNDIEMLSTVLPYCDAILVDNEMYEILSHGQVYKALAKYDAKIFSKNNIHDFFAYLDDIKKQADQRHLEKVAEVYGNGWPRPFWEMYQAR